MRSDKKGKYHAVLDEDVIRRAFEGDGNALSEVIMAYEDYVVALIIVTAARYGMTKNEIPVEDISQMVWVKFITKSMNRFRIAD